MKNLFLSTLALLSVTFSNGQETAKNAKAATGKTTPVKNIVIVHGAFADGSGWRGVHDILVAKGYNVTIVQNPLTSLEDDVAAVNRVLLNQNGPVILVGHSWGGAVITQAGTDAKVAGLVYVAAYQPQAGESTLDLAKTEIPAEEKGILPPDANGFLFYSKEKFHAGFAGGVSKAESDFLYDSQAPISIKAFITPLTQTAWKNKPSWAIIATQDKSITPAIQYTMAKRAGSVVTEVKSSHIVYITHPQEVANAIIAASVGATPVK
ncbi:alpha/beta hydrolase [Flavobacterium subsaxonicum]|uniref:Hydrolase n=1 Tax=Flavobacterium subsaxonicum WB 4.1-42 = DSM 21790 TaxID=1121898 RepID=A0A0A2MGW8_9FLAO|nr:alpha/beta hydrolase [Flavobacterium subsaxonicum]KGO91529.1 hydrolase [Flavobacterium subsaxonicum WB 4.1-42 = DSM 21790]